MIEIRYDELKRAMDYLENNSEKHRVSVQVNNSKLIMKAISTDSQDIEIVLHDMEYTMKPTVKKQEKL